MIVPQSAHIGRMLQYVGRPLLMLVAYDLVVVLAFQVLHWHWMSFPNVPLALLGSAIGVIMGFRNNSAYDRWWEARKLWGTIVNNSRSWARQVLQIDASETDDLHTTQRRMIYLHIAFVHALRQHLRRLEPWGDLQRLLPKEDIDSLRGDENVPLRLNFRWAKYFADALKEDGLILCNGLRWIQH